MEFFGNIGIHFYIAIALAIVNGAMMCMVGYKFLQVLQLGGYKMSSYVEWVKDTKGKYISRVAFLSFLSIAGVLVTNAVFDSYIENGHLSYLGLIFYFYFSIVFIKNLFDAPKKIPLKNTNRMSRLNICLFLIMTIVTFGLISLSTEYVTFLRYGIISITPLILIIAIPIAHFIMLPLEAVIRLKYIYKAKKVLNKMPDLIKIGITGSYGKTSCKYILNTMLSKKYSVCMSPHSFNTPMGITKVVLKYLKPYDQILIAEMGANQVGDINYLCNIINPKMGILTAIGSQHLRTFKSLDNIKNTKNELIKSLEKVNGYAVFNGDNEGAKELYDEANIEKSYTSINNENASIYVKNIALSENGMTFDMVLDDGVYPCETKLLGEHNISNILLCACMAKKIGVSSKDIVQAISELKPVPHRLELKTKYKGFKVLDDSFNASVEGAESALKVLSLFEGKKIVITPGLVDLGSMEHSENVEFGKKIAKVADVCIVVNKANRESVKEGLELGGFSEEQIIVKDNFSTAFLALKEIVELNNTCVLIENDLPDNYT